MELHELGIAALGRGYRKGEFSPIEVVEALLDRIVTVGRSIDAFACVTEKAARKHADEAEYALVEGDDRPLLGVPVVLKDLIDTAGIPTEAGSKVFAGRVPDEDASVWAALRSAGCVLLGKARTHEFAFGTSTPPTKNPWSLDRTPGGSSGGSAAALAAGLSPAAVGTDTGGSIRIPSGLCGTVGFKPTQHVVATAGVVPLSWTLDHVGPMARSPVDCQLLLEAMTPGVHDWEDKREVLIEKRVAMVTNSGPLTEGVQQAVERAAAALEDAGADVEPVEVPGFEECVDVDFTIIGAEAALYHRPWFEEQRHRYTSGVEPRIAAGYDITRAAYLEARKDAERYRRLFVDILDERDFLLVAGMPAPAPPHGSTKVQMGAAVDQFDRALCRNTSFANLTGLPSLALPAGDEDGLPVGVQLAGSHFQDFTILEAGQELWERLAPKPLAPL